MGLGGMSREGYRQAVWVGVLTVLWAGTGGPADGLRRLLEGSGAAVWCDVMPRWAWVALEVAFVVLLVSLPRWATLRAVPRKVAQEVQRELRREMRKVRVRNGRLS